MRVELASLESLGGKFAHEYELGELSLDEERIDLAEPPGVAGRIRRMGARVMVEGQIAAGTRIECNRCLAPIATPVNTEFRVEFVTPDVYQAEQAAQLAEEDLALSVFDGEVIDVDEIVREQLLLNVPSYALCQESCKGLCPVCGVDRNRIDCNCQTAETDPRWSELENLRS